MKALAVCLCILSFLAGCLDPPQRTETAPSSSLEVGPVKVPTVSVTPEIVPTPTPKERAPDPAPTQTTPVATHANKSTPVTYECVAPPIYEGPWSESNPDFEMHARAGAEPAKGTLPIGYERAIIRINVGDEDCITFVLDTDPPTKWTNTSLIFELPPELTFLGGDLGFEGPIAEGERITRSFRFQATQAGEVWVTSRWAINGEPQNAHPPDFRYIVS